MVHLLVQASKYLMIILLLIYTFNCFNIFKYQDDKKRQTKTYALQRRLIYFIHFDGFLVLYLTSNDIKIIGLYLMQLILIIAVYVTYHKFYQSASELILNNMNMLICIGMIILTRLSYSKAERQFLFLVAGIFLALFIPLILRRGSNFRNLKYVYAAVGVISLLLVAIAGSTSYGAKLSLSIAGISIQPSEFVKILFVFFIASMLYKSHDIKQFIITSGVSAVFVLILVASKDLGGALLYFFTYLVMVYAATQKFYIFAGGLGCMSAAAIIGYNLFSHVKTRVIAWKDPLSVIDNQGYQICQSLFAIGTGGWFGLGLNQGMPKKIPVVEKDFVFSAISEEMGAIFALCIILVCISCFLMIFNVALRMKDKFYKLVALGLGSVYALQVFLTIGGVIKFIPSTGVTLPLVSYGGSSLLSTLIIFGIIQGLYIIQDDEMHGNKKGMMNEKNKNQKRSTAKKKINTK